MSELLALSYDDVTAPVISLKHSQEKPRTPHTETSPRGWGFGWFPGSGLAGQTIKDPLAGAGDSPARFQQEWNRFGSTIYLGHFRGPAQHRSQSDAQPFKRNFSGRAWIIAHSGTLRDDWHINLPLRDNPVFEPVGRTDTEHIFCWILNHFHEEGIRTLKEAGWIQLHEILKKINDLGPLNLILSDGQSLAVYQDKDTFQNIYWSRHVPPHSSSPQNNILKLELDEHQSHRTYLAFATAPLSENISTQMSPGQLLIARRGQITWDSLAVWGLSNAQSGNETMPNHFTPPPGDFVIPLDDNLTRPLSIGEDHDITPPPAGNGWKFQWQSGRIVREERGPVSQKLHVLHETRYRYKTAVESSKHLMRLRPIEDSLQSLDFFELSLSVDGETHYFEDVFGNQTLELTVTAPFSEFLVRAESIVCLNHFPALEYRTPHPREQIPLVWMPWQRQMMLPYLLPPELPESNLIELTDFAMSFAERNDYNLRATLLDINRTIYRDFKYLPGVTTLETTPYEILTRRNGVCQDFANLMICLARLINIPARYRVGYIDALATPENPVQSEASHAWVEVYLPGSGWIGFDPTNGKLVEQDHIRVACGRNYRDATPTMGTLYKGGESETLEVNVKVKRLDP